MAVVSEKSGSQHRDRIADRLAALLDDPEVLKAAAELPLGNLSLQILAKAFIIRAAADLAQPPSSGETKPV